MKWIKQILAIFKIKLLGQNVIKGKMALGLGTTISDSYIEGELASSSNCIIKSVNINGRIQIGKFTSLWGPNINLNGHIIIGSFCSIASNVSIFEYNHISDRLTTYFIFRNLFHEQRTESISKGKIEIGSDVWIANGVTILSGVKIGHGAIIAANSLINSDVPPYAIVGGVPAKILSYRFSNEIIKELLELKWWDWDLEKIKKNKELFTDSVTQEKLNSFEN